MGKEQETSTSAAAATSKGWKTSTSAAAMGNVKRMEIEAKRRDIEFMKKCTEHMEKKSEEEEEEEKKDESDPVLNPVWQTKGISELSFWIARDSNISCLGAKHSGEPGYGRNFRDFDLLDLSEVVNIGPPIIRKRRNGKAVIARKNIYFFGGAKKAPWGEVLEIKGGGEGAKWKALNKPPMWIPPFDVFAFPLDDAANGIIVTSGRMDDLFLYNIFEDSWNVLDEKFSFDGPSFTEPVIVGRSIYWVGSDEFMCSYDLDTKELYRGDINFLPMKDALDTSRQTQKQKIWIRNWKAEWKALNEPPMRIPSLDVFAFPLGDAASGIIVTSDSMDGLFLYNVFEDSWNVLDEKFSFNGPSFTEPVIVERSIYWVGSDEFMCSYNLETKELYHGDTNFLSMKDALDTVRVCRISYRLPFLHLHGDIFCLIWLDANYDRSHPRSVFVFHKMHVSRRFGKKELGEHSLRVKLIMV
ncbi:hypothetical protein RHGRI_012319 [Rhododendron griersonianum]|uniref:Galactose oxidase/kelch repeat superfamily protein n=1 Tax=Rhododendron griersonianum TaxID=479676 RepID=A0AAV6KQN0_9ERIC|nr:hypothetical protein RHGRI_012319 [Rhododendron griersonianum]